MWKSAIEFGDCRQLTLLSGGAAEFGDCRQMTLSGVGRVGLLGEGMDAQQVVCLVKDVPTTRCHIFFFFFRRVR